jgi:hypothetical protein
MDTIIGEPVLNSAFRALRYGKNDRSADIFAVL